MTDIATGGAAAHELTPSEQNRRQVLYWRLLAQVFDTEEQPTLETASAAVVDDLGLPRALLDRTVTVDTVVQRFPEVGEQLERLDELDSVRTAALVSKLLLNVFATGNGPVTASQLAGWQSDARCLGRVLGGRGQGLADEDLAGSRGSGDSNGSGGSGGSGDSDGTGGSDSTGATGGSDGQGGPVSSGRGGPGRGTSSRGGRALGAGELEAQLAAIEADMVKRMKLREVLADPKLAAQLTPSMSLVEQLLRDKHNLSGVALANAKALIRRFVEEVAQVLRTQVQQTSTGKIDRSVPPKRVFRNLDIERTIWKNLTNWSPEDERLYVDRLFYRHTANRTTPARMIVVVDQSGSMVDAMVNCTILASIFTGLPKVDVHLVAYDTRALDLTPWVHDPFEVLLRTTLGGGTDGTVAMALARPKIADPRNTVMVWISDFYDNRQLMTDFEAIHRSGVKLIPVGSVSSSGAASVDPWFRQKLKDLGTPVISGKITKLVVELKNFLNT